MFAESSATIYYNNYNLHDLKRLIIIQRNCFRVDIINMVFINIILYICYYNCITFVVLSAYINVLFIIILDTRFNPLYLQIICVISVKIE